MSWSASYGGKTIASGSSSSISITSNQTPVVVASGSANIDHTGAYSTTAYFDGYNYGNQSSSASSVTLPALTLWNDINAYQPDGTTQHGLVFNLTTSDGGSWTDLTNEPDNFSKLSGTSATISDIRSNVTGAHYSGTSEASGTPSTIT